MSGHTPGEWKAGEDAILGWVPVYGPAGQSVCLVESGPRISNEERSANAKLIAQAPLLPEAIEALRELVEARERNCARRGYQPVDGTDGRYLRARAILQRYEEGTK